MDDRYIRELEDSIEPIWELARGFGLDPFPVHFELVPASIMYEFGSYGLPGRFSHWSHGKMYNRMKTQYDYGLSKIYELVINTDPSYAFLMEANSLLQNKLVIAHVLGHCDFFKNNAYFANTNRRMVETASLNAARIRRYEQEHGLPRVERFLDSVLSIQEHIDPYSEGEAARKPRRSEEESAPGKAPTTPFDDLFDLTPDDRPRPEPPRRAEMRFPAQPEKDIVGFIMEHARYLEPWQRDVIGIVRQEMLYFVPQMQTKTINEGWACATGDSLVLSESGLVRFDDLYHAGKNTRVASGGEGSLNTITDYHMEEDVPTIRIRTRRGLTLEGALKHRLLMADGSWAYLRDVKLGDRVALELGSNVWPRDEQPLQFSPRVKSPNLELVASHAGVSVSTVMRYLGGRITPSAGRIDEALRVTAYQPGWRGKVIGTRNSLRLPATLNADLAWILGYFIGDGNRTKSGIGFTTGDTELADKLVGTIAGTLGLQTRTRWDPTSANGRWRVWVHSRDLKDWLMSIGIDLEARAATKRIPSLVLRSPKHIVSAFLRGYFDADAYAGKAGIILSSASTSLINTVQQLLLNYGILSIQKPQRDGCIHLRINSSSAARFYQDIGFSLSRKQEALRSFVEGHLWFKKEDKTDDIVSITYGRADVFDITVDHKHSYVANGFVNHNSMWHARIMRELDLTDSEFTEYADLNSSVVAPSRHSLNPYYVGVKLLEDIERRWDEPTEEERRTFGRKGGEGRAKLFEVRQMENDVSLIRNYMTEQLVEDLDLYLYERQGDQWVIVDKNWENVRDGIVARMANFGNPTILVEDGDYRHSGELLLHHMHDGQDLDLKYAQKTMEYVFALWSRPVHLWTVQEGEETLLTYNGEEHTHEAA